MVCLRPCLASQHVTHRGLASGVLCMQECLQDEVVTLQRQLTWLQSHASLQDQINKDLMQEVLHLREAVALLSVTPLTES